MRYFVLTLILFSILLSAYAELDQNDLDKIRLIVKDEVDEATKNSETRMREHANTKFESVDKRLTHQANITYALIALIAIAIIPQYIFLWRSRTDEALKRQVETLTQEIEMLKNQRIQNP